MPLIAQEPQGEKRRPPWRGVVVGAASAVVFVFGLALAAFLTNDTPRGVPHTDVPPAPQRTAALDAGVVDEDAGPAVIGPRLARPVIVPGPPVDAGAAAGAVLPVVDECLKAALRFDPSLAGTATLHIVAADGALTGTLLRSPSPALSSCVEAKAHLAFPAAPAEPVVVEAKVELDGLRRMARVAAADIVVPN